MFIWPWAAGTGGLMSILQSFWLWLYGGWRLASSECAVKRSEMSAASSVCLNKEHLQFTKRLQMGLQIMRNLEWTRMRKAVESCSCGICVMGRFVCFQVSPSWLTFPCPPNIFLQNTWKRSWRNIWPVLSKSESCAPRNGKDSFAPDFLEHPSLKEKCWLSWTLIVRSMWTGCLLC